MRTSLLTGMTTRGICFLTAGIVSVLLGYALGERGLLCVGIALAALPVLAAVAARRGQYRLATARIITPPQVPIGHTATATLRLENISRVPTGLLLAEDTVPYALGSRPRYVLDKIERHGVRQLTYPLRSDLRGKFEIGPLQLRVTDSFGLVELTHSASGRTTFIVTPKVVPLSRTVISRTWAGEGEGRARLTSTAGEDDVIPREYRDGDELRRVHWRSTARYGELMVRREEQRWRNRATIFLDTRSISHLGSGPNSSFEAAVSAAASVGVHITRQGLTGQFITEGEALRGSAMFSDVLLDTLATIRPSYRRNLDQAFPELKASGGVIIAILGRITVPEARRLAACRTEGSQGLALLLDVGTWAEDRQRAGGPGPEETGAQARPGRNGARAGQNGARAGQNGARADQNGARADQNGARADQNGAQADQNGQPRATRPPEVAAADAILLNAGWHVTVLDAATPLSVSWRRLSQPRTGIVRPGPEGGAEAAPAAVTGGPSA